jgi:outer membrane biosynthesis protein TonB
MANEAGTETSAAEGRLGGCLLWFFWGVSLSFMTILSLALLILLAASVTLNVYLGWELSGLEVSISRSGSGGLPPLAATYIPTDVLAAIPTQTPVPTSTATPFATVSPLEEQVATLSALATQVAGPPTGAAPVQATPLPPAVPIQPPTGVPPAVAIDAPQAQAAAPQPADSASPATTTAPQPADSASPATTTAPIATPAAVSAASQEEAAAEFVPPATSSNTYNLIPLEGQRESRPPEEHGDLNLKLRDPQSIEVDLSLQDLPGSGVDPNAPNFSKIFKPEFTRAYTVHDWDWGCNCKGKLLQEEHLVLLGLKTTPGQPVFIPPKEGDIYGGNYYATVLYASEDSLTFLYARAGSVVKGYTIHYLGLHTDPNLVAKFRESKGNELPGLTLDTPVGVAGDELIVAIRDNGKFLDMRSKRDWWE